MALPANWVFVGGCRGFGRRKRKEGFAVVTGLDFQATLWQKGLTLLMPNRSGLNPSYSFGF